MRIVGDIVKMKKLVLVVSFLLLVVGNGWGESSNPLSIEGRNPLNSVNGFYNSLEFTNPFHAAIVFKPGTDNELMTGFSADGNFYWGFKSTSDSGTHSMILSKEGKLFVRDKIGIGTDDPRAKLDIRGDNSDLSIGDNFSEKLQFGYDTAGKYGWIRSLTNSGAAGNLLLQAEGNVGIGTPEPGAKLTIIGNSDTEGTMTLHSPKGVDKSHIHYGSLGDWYIRSAAPTGKVVLQDNSGNVGIGASSPNAKLDIEINENDNLKTTLELRNNGTGNTRMRIAAAAHSGGDPFILFDSGGSDFVVGQFYQPSNNQLRLGAGSEPEGVDSLVIQANGTVGIGIQSPDSNYKLDVAGKIKSDYIQSKEIRVSQANIDTLNIKTEAWADYVFKDDYQLPSLDSVETFIKENKHLPDVPSEKEVKENGLNMSEMMATQMKKIEELTLYMIEMKKENKLLKAEMAELKKTVIK